MLIYITAEPTSAMLIRRGRRIADFLRADCFAVHVSRRADLTHLGAQQRQAIEQYLNFARNLHIETRLLEGKAVMPPEAQPLISALAKYR